MGWSCLEVHWFSLLVAHFWFERCFFKFYWWFQSCCPSRPSINFNNLVFNWNLVIYFFVQLVLFILFINCQPFRIDFLSQHFHERFSHGCLILIKDIKCSRIQTQKVHSLRIASFLRMVFCLMLSSTPLLLKWALALQRGDSFEKLVTCDVGPSLLPYFEILLSHRNFLFTRCRITLAH